MGTCGTRGPARYVAAPAPQCRLAEEKLLKSLLPQAQVFDTAVELKNFQVSLHSVEVAAPDTSTNEPPLLCLPGYGTGGAIFVACWKYMLDNIFAPHGPLPQRRLIAIDPLGMFLSSRPPWSPSLDVTSAEEWFVESLEAWCQLRGLAQMDLLGHSIGGNIASAFSERYPERIRKLILLSPAGLCREPSDYRQKLRNAPWRIRLMFRLWGRGWSPMRLVRCLPRSRGQRICRRTVQRWLGRAASQLDEETQNTLADYIFYGWTEGPESAGRVLSALLHPGAWGKKPLVERLPQLRGIDSLELIYGDRDWMDVRHGNQVAEAEGASLPTVVQLLMDAGHYAHVETIPAFAKALLQALSRANDQPCTCAPIPAGYAARFVSTPEKPVPKWRSWEGYEFGR